MFSQGLVAAYRLESGTARYPRVLVDVNLIELMKYHGPNDQVAELLGWECASDADGAIFLDFFEPGKIDEFSAAVRDLLSKANIELVGVLEKYEWLQRYADFCCDRDGTARVSFALPQIKSLH